MLVADGRGTSGALIVEDDAKKIVKLNGMVKGENALAIGLAGVVGYEDEIIEALLSGEMSHLPHELDYSGIVITDKGAYSLFSKLYDDDEPSDGMILPGTLYRDTGNIVIGSGMVAAHSALKLGLDAVGAVKHAITMDIYSGGKITKMRLR